MSEQRENLLSAFLPEITSTSTVICQSLSAILRTRYIVDLTKPSNDIFLANRNFVGCHAASAAGKSSLDVDARPAEWPWPDVRRARGPMCLTDRLRASPAGFGRAL